LIGGALFAEIVLVVLATMLLTPLLLRWAYAQSERRAAPSAAQLPNTPEGE
jgi:hypothetical protein